MASTSKAFLVFAFLAINCSVAFAARNAPTDDAKWLGHFDGSVLIPGFGRVMVPKKGDKSLDYNPITGTHGGNGFSVPGVGGSTGRTQIPGGDDTFMPNPGMEAPTPSGH